MKLLSIKSVNKIGKGKTLDFEVDHKDHNFYCEGIVVSNSHSVATGSLSALTTYLKYKYPIQFYTACLNNVHNFPNPVEHLSEIVREINLFGLKLMPPDITNSSLSFTYKDDVIYMPVSSIKGISKKAISKLAQFKITNANKLEIFKAAEDAGIARNIFSSLVLVGSLDKFLNKDTRSRLLLEYILYKKLTDTEKNYLFNIFADCNHSVFDSVKYMNEVAKTEKGKEVMKNSRRETLRDYIVPHWKMFQQNEKNIDIAYYFFERELLGFAYTKSLLDIYQDKVRDLTDIFEIQNRSEDEYCRFIGNVVEVKMGVSKKGTEYMKMTLADEKGQINCMSFNTANKKNIDLIKEVNNRLPQEKDIVICSGQKKGDSVFLDSCGIQDISVWLKVSQIND